MNSEDQSLWVAEVALSLTDVLANNPDLDEKWYEKVMHVASHAAQADIDTLREAFMILAVQRGDGPDKAHAAIVGATLLFEGRAGYGE